MLLIVKHFHVWFAILSISGFVLRFIWLNHRPQLLQQRWVKILPHVNDTALLASGVSMAIGFGYSFHTFSWLLVKLLLVVVYIVFGALTLKLQIASLYRFMLFSLSLILYFSILTLAVMKHTSNKPASQLG